MGRGRYRLTTNSARKLRIGNITNAGIFKDEQGKEFTVQWSDNNSISCDMDFIENDITLTINYQVIRPNESPIQRTQVIKIEKLPTNFGSGFIYYFICPYTCLRVKTLYMAYGSEYFRCRQAYINIGFPLYYYSQTLSGRSRLLEQEELIVAKIEDLESQREQYEYNGKETKRSEKLSELKDRLNEIHGQLLKQVWLLLYRKGQ